MMSEPQSTGINPYEMSRGEGMQAVSAPQGRPLSTRDYLIALLPLLPIASVYLLWLLAGLLLGHVPRPYLDDPKYINTVFGWLYISVSIGMVSFPVIDLGAIIYPFFNVDRSLMRRSFFSMVALISGIAAFVLIRWDPISVIDWFMD